MDRLFDDSLFRSSRFWPDSGMGEPLVDIYQTANDLVVKAALPGVRPEDVDISITGDIITIKGEHKEDQEIKEENYLRKEHRYGAFSRSVTIPISIQSDKAEAVFENGVLTLTLPKAEEVKPKQIKVKAHPVIESAKSAKK
jgi:HSP20 family protein